MSTGDDDEEWVQLATLRTRLRTVLGDLDTSLRWRLVREMRDESRRWESVDGRWVALELGEGPDLGSVVVTDSTGRRELVASFDRALEIAKAWRT